MAHRKSAGLRRLLAMGMLLGLCGCGAPSARGQPLVLERTVELQGVGGRIDHLAVDPARRRLYVAALGAGAVEAIDLDKGRVFARAAGLKEPQGVAYLPARDEIAVASGGDGTLRFFRASDLAPAGEMTLGADADNVRLDPRGGRIVVGYGAGALAVIDPASRTVVRSTPVPAHPEGFQLDGDRAFVNLPDAGRIGVTDLAKGALVASWANGDRRWNFPLAFDAASRQVAIVYRLPARLVILNAASGAQQQVLGTCGDSDDVFFDARRGRLYVACGDGHIDVFARQGAQFGRIARIATSPGARTALFAPTLDRLYLAGRATGGQPAAIRVYRPE